MLCVFLSGLSEISLIQKRTLVYHVSIAVGQGEREEPYTHYHTHEVYLEPPRPSIYKRIFEQIEVQLTLYTILVRTWPALFVKIKEQNMMNKNLPVWNRSPTKPPSSLLTSTSLPLSPSTISFQTSHVPSQIFLTIFAPSFLFTHPVRDVEPGMGAAFGFLRVWSHVSPNASVTVASQPTALSHTNNSSRSFQIFDRVVSP